MTAANEYPDSPGVRWWDAPGWLRTRLLRLDGKVGAVVDAEKHLTNPAVVSAAVADQLGRLVQQAGDRVVEQPRKAPGFEPVKPGFTRETGSIPRQVRGR